MPETHPFRCINNDPAVQPAYVGTAMAFDYGEMRVGVAIGEHALGIAHPLTTIVAESVSDKFLAIQKLLQEWQPTSLIVGWPTHADGTPHEMTRLSEKFARRLDGRFGLPVLLVDERYTSEQAASTLHQAGVHGAQLKARLDQVAAQHILQSYFDALPLASLTSAGSASADQNTSSHAGIGHHA